MKVLYIGGVPWRTQNFQTSPTQKKHLNLIMYPIEYLRKVQLNHIILSSPDVLSMGDFSSRSPSISSSLLAVLWPCCLWTQPLPVSPSLESKQRHFGSAVRPGVDPKVICYIAIENGHL